MAGTRKILHVSTKMMAAQKSAIPEEYQSSPLLTLARTLREVAYEKAAIKNFMITPRLIDGEMEDLQCLEIEWYGARIWYVWYLEPNRYWVAEYGQQEPNNFWSNPRYEQWDQALEHVLAYEMPSWIEQIREARDPKQPMEAIQKATTSTLEKFENAFGEMQRCLVLGEILLRNPQQGIRDIVFRIGSYKFATDFATNMGTVAPLEAWKVFVQAMVENPVIPMALLEAPRALEGLEETFGFAKKEEKK